MEQKIRLLVADSDELTRAVLGEIFAPEYAVTEISESHTLLEFIHKGAEQYAALLLGALPVEQQTVELLEKLSEEGIPDELPVFLMLQSSTDGKAARGIAAGALDIIEKPFNPAVVRRRVSNGIELYGRRSHSDLLQKVSTLLTGTSGAFDEQARLRDRTLRLLELERQKYQILSELSSDITFTYDCIRQEAVFSERYREIFGGEVCQQGAFATIVASHLLPEDIGALRVKMVSAITKENPFFKTEVRLRTADGSVKWFELYIRGFFESNDPDLCTTCLGKLTSIDELKQETTRWKKLARTDSLTGLCNRRAIRDMTGMLLQNGTTLGVMFIDVDDFKEVNDGHGHLFGNWVLCQVAKVLSDNFRSNDIIGRVGGDEFIAVIKDIPSRDILGIKAAALGERLRGLKLPDGKEFPITCSIGIAFCPDDGTQYDQLLERADQALYYVKNHGNDGWAYYDAALLSPAGMPSIFSNLSDIDPSQEK